MSTYAREWFVYPEMAEELPVDSRIRLGLTTDRGTPTQFLVQLEFWDGRTWLEVVRFDHEADGPPYRDVERTGIHLDVYAPGRGQIEKRKKWPPEPASDAMGDAEEYLRENAEWFVRRFETWL